jgi:hypothetical protein
MIFKCLLTLGGVDQTDSASPETLISPLSRNRKILSRIGSDQALNRAATRRRAAEDII